MRLQKVQLDNLNKWLSEMENKLKNLPALGPTLDALKSQVEMQKVFFFISNFGNIMEIIKVIDILYMYKQLYLTAFLFLFETFHLLLYKVLIINILNHKTFIIIIISKRNILLHICFEKNRVL